MRLTLSAKEHSYGQTGRIWQKKKTNRPAITDYVAKENYVINWSDAKILDEVIVRQNS